jgi:hypothetical protein
MSTQPFVTSQHYYVKLSKPLSVAKWFETVEAMKRWALTYGYEIDEFGDCHEVNREVTRKRGEVEEFEGLLIQTRPKASIDLEIFFSNRSLVIEHSEFD